MCRRVRDPLLVAAGEPMALLVLREGASVLDEPHAQVQQHRDPHQHAARVALDRFPRRHVPRPEKLPDCLRSR
jgi:hypothetical protein